MRVLDLFSGYSVTEDGVVRNSKGMEIARQVSWNGYERVELWKGGKGRKFLVHRLVAEAFVSNPDGKPSVNHVDGNKLNNSAANLEWVTQSENQRHAYSAGLQKGHHVSGLKLSEKHRDALRGSRWRGSRRIYHAEGRIFDAPEAVADAFGVSRQTVYNRAVSSQFPSWKIEVVPEEAL